MLFPPATSCGGALLEPVELLFGDLGRVTSLVTAIGRRAHRIDELAVCSPNGGCHTGLLKPYGQNLGSYGLNNRYSNRSATNTNLFEGIWFPFVAALCVECNTLSRLKKFNLPHTSIT